MQWKPRFFLPGQHDDFRRQLRSIQGQLLEMRNQVWTVYEPSSPAGRAIGALHESRLFRDLHKAMDALQAGENKKSGRK